MLVNLWQNDSREIEYNAIITPTGNWQYNSEKRLKRKLNSRQNGFGDEREKKEKNELFLRKQDT